MVSVTQFPLVFWNITVWGQLESLIVNLFLNYCIYYTFSMKYNDLDLVFSLETEGFDVDDLAIKKVSWHLKKHIWKLTFLVVRLKLSLIAFSVRWARPLRYHAGGAWTRNWFLEADESRCEISGRNRAIFQVRCLAGGIFGQSEIPPGRVYHTQWLILLPLVSISI